ncbi:MAG: SpoIIE family protein phosphatase [Thermoanaerobaculales bacterium]|nr:SpoIIE family protein phosphatase [Thermoanaerobaculales bacterium]
MTCSSAAALDHEQGTVGAAAPDTVVAGDQPQAEISPPPAESVDADHTRKRLILGIAAAVVSGLALALIVALVKRSRDRLKRRYAKSVGHILENLTDGVIIADENGDVLFANEAAAAISGTRRPDVSLTEWSSVHGIFLPGSNRPLPPEDLPLTRAIRGETIADVELRVRNPRVPHGIHILVRGGPLLGIRGDVQGGVVVFRNVGERKKDEERIRRLSNVVQQTADAVIVTNREGTIEYVNPAFESTTGYTSEEAVGRSPRILKSGRQSPEFYRELWATVTGGSTFRGMTINRKKNGELYHSEQTITPMTDEHGEITHFVSVNKDMTERRKVEEQAIELDLASLVQQRLYPASDPDIPGYDLAGAVSSAEATSGDYYDFVLLPDGTVVIVVADVSGHGLGPALVMAETRAYLRSLTRATGDLVTITAGLNDFLFADLQDNHFVTMLLARLDPPTGRLNFVNAAHPAGAIVARSGKLVASLSSTCLPIGMFGETWRGVMQQVEIEAGETAVFATDGVLECESPEGEAFGADRVLEVVSSHRRSSAAEIVAEVHRAVREFRQGERQEDDVTVVVLKRLTICPKYS